MSNSFNPIDIPKSFYLNCNLILQMIKREILSRYKGSFFGILWSLFNPLLMLLIYTFVFGMVFESKWSGIGNTHIEFALILSVGFFVFNLFAECVIKSPTLILNNVNFVKKVVFPLEVLPWITLGVSIFHFLINMTMWILVYSLFLKLPNFVILFAPFILLPYFFLIMGVSWFLASLGVYVRDISQIISIVVSALMFMSPIFYPTSSIPLKYQYLFYFNPLSMIIESIRNLFYWGKMPDIEALLFYTLFSFLFLCLGFFWFQKTRKGFADVI